VAVSEHLATILGPPGQPLAARLLVARDLGDLCGPDDWPPLRDAATNPATPDEVAMGSLQAITRLYRRGLIGDDDVRPVLDAFAGGRDDWCGSQAVELLAAVPTEWAVAGLNRYVAPGWPGREALRALARHRHVVALSELRRHATDHTDDEVRRTAAGLFDEEVGWTLRLAALGDQAADTQRRTLAALVALRSWADVLILLRAGRGDAFSRECLRRLPDRLVTGKGGAALLRSIRAAAGRV
jgi:hypothetical protein